MTHSHASAPATVPTAARAAPPQRSPTTGIVHLGLGNFHRAHQAVYTAAALAHTDGPWGILGVAGRSRRRGRRDARPGACATRCVEIAPGPDPGHRARRAHRRAASPRRSREAVPARSRRPATAIVTLTVTEHGYTYSPRTHGLDLDAPAVRADLGGDGPPRTTSGQHRARPAAPAARPRRPDHGAQLRQPGRQRRAHGRPGPRVRRGPARGRARRAAALADAAVTFPNGMVDRIVPATTDGYRGRSRRGSACATPIPVPAEPFTMWVLEDRFAAGRPGVGARRRDLHRRRARATSCSSCGCSTAPIR